MMTVERNAALTSHRQCQMLVRARRLTLGRPRYGTLDERAFFSALLRSASAETGNRREHAAGTTSSDVSARSATDFYN